MNAVVRFPTKRKAAYRSPFLGPGEPPANVVRLRERPPPETAAATPVTVLLDALMHELSGEAFAGLCGRLATKARDGDANARVALLIATGSIA